MPKNSSTIPSNHRKQHSATMITMSEASLITRKRKNCIWKSNLNFSIRKSKKMRSISRINQPTRQSIYSTWTFINNNNLHLQILFPRSIPLCNRRSKFLIISISQLKVFPILICCLIHSINKFYNNNNHILFLQDYNKRFLLYPWRLLQLHPISK